MRRQPDRSPDLLHWYSSPSGPQSAQVYAVHPGALAPSAWHELAAALPEGTGFALLDLQAIPEFLTAAWSPDDAALPGIPELADRFLAALAADGPDGRPDGRLADRPFRLVGWSFGGIVAFEMATRLHAAGSDDLLADLVLLDSIAPVPDFKRPDELLDAGMLLRWFGMYLGAKRNQPFIPQLPPVDSRAEGLPLLLDAAVAQGVLPPDTELAGLGKLYDAYLGGLSRNNRCTNPYQPAPLDRPLTLVKAEHSLLPGRGDLGWSELTRHSLHQQTVPGDHYTMLREPSAVTALSGLLATPAAV